MEETTSQRIDSRDFSPSRGLSNTVETAPETMGGPREGPLPGAAANVRLNVNDLGSGGCRGEDAEGEGDEGKERERAHGGQ